MIKAVIFDMGGVLLRTEDSSGRRRWAARFGMAEEDLANAVFDSPVAAAATVGQASVAAVWEAVRHRFQLSAAELRDFQRDFWSGDQFDEPLIEWVATLRGRYRTGILSNAWEDARQFFASQPKIVEAFEEFIISAEEGLMKPQPEIYERAVARLDVQPEEAVFVDDMLDNVVAARGVGLAAIQYTPGLDVPRALARFDVSSPPSDP